MNILQEIFKDNYEQMVYILHPRASVIENVDKMINCGDPSFGGAMYGCTHCGNLKFVPFRCHSRFCPTCGNMYSIDRTTAMSFKIVSVKHRHCVFTIDDSLRHWFLEDRSLLNDLFSAVNSVVSRMFLKDSKAEHFTPGFICVLHTFGRDLKWNPHIHCLISEGGLGNSGRWKSKPHFNYKYLRDAWQTALLSLMHQHIGNAFRKDKVASYRNHKNGFYVYAEPKECNPGEVINYIGRYLGRPVIATSRIDKYDGENVTFHYNRHEDDVYVEETIPALDFIGRVIQHIPEKHFKMIRYYGLYARHRGSDKKLHRAISREKHRIMLSFNRWQASILSSFGYDPCTCSKCGHTMVFLDLYYNHKRVSLNDLYERTLLKHRLGKYRPPDYRSSHNNGKILYGRCAV